MGSDSAFGEPFYKPLQCNLGQHLFQRTGNRTKTWTSNGSSTNATPPDGVPVQEEWKCSLCGETILAFEGDTP